MIVVRLGVRTTALVSLATFAAMSVVFGLAHGYDALLLARFAQGLAGAACWTAAMLWLLRHGRESGVFNPGTGTARSFLDLIKAVGTDPKMYNNAMRQSDPGIYSGMLLPPPALGVFVNPASTKDMLASSVIGAIIFDAFQCDTQFHFPIASEFNGISYQVDDDLGEPRRIRYNPVRHVGTNVPQQFQALLVGPKRHWFHDPR